MLNEIFELVDKELEFRRNQLDCRDAKIGAQEDELNEFRRELKGLQEREEELNGVIAEQNTELSALRADVRLDWKRRYEKLTGHHGRTVDKLQRQLVEQAEDMHRMEAEIRRLHGEIAERAEKHIAIRDDNMRLWAERMNVHQQEQRAVEMTMAAGPVHEENERLWCENQLLKAALVKADPEEAKRYAV